MKGRLDAVIPQATGDGGWGYVVINGEQHKFPPFVPATVDDRSFALFGEKGYLEDFVFLAGCLVDYSLDSKNEIAGFNVRSQYRISSPVIDDRPGLWISKSDPTTQFTSAIAQNAKEDEELLLIGNRVKITSISIQAKEQLRFRVLFWYNQAIDDADLSVDSFMADQEMDLTTYGYQIGGAGQYYMSVHGLSIPAIDYRTTRLVANTLFVSLMNLSAAAKTAGANGAVKLLFGYEPWR